MPRTQSERRSRELAVRPVRPIGPYHPIPLTVDSLSPWWELEISPSVDSCSIPDRHREIFEFEGGVGAF